jgi:hypothetical protein
MRNNTQKLGDITDLLIDETFLYLSFFFTFPFIKEGNVRRVRRECSRPFDRQRYKCETRVYSRPVPLPEKSIFSIPHTGKKKAIRYLISFFLCWGNISFRFDYFSYTQKERKRDVYNVFRSSRDPPSSRVYKLFSGSTIYPRLLATTLSSVGCLREILFNIKRRRG